MGVSEKKIKLMTNTKDISTDIISKGEELETVPSFKYQETTVSDKESRPEMLSWTVQTAARKTETHLKQLSVTISSKIRLR